MIYGKEKKKGFRVPFEFTLRMSLVIGLGPLDENETTYGAYSFLLSKLLNIVAVGFLFQYYGQETHL